MPAGTGDSYAIPYPPIERLAVVGDRRTAALIAADGTACWMCLPNYDGAPVFGALLDAAKGGFWRIGPRARRFGRQRYVEGTACVETTWEDDDGALVLVDAMALPGDRRSPADEPRRVLIRHLRCARGRARARIELAAVQDFREPFSAAPGRNGSIVFAGEPRLALWCSAPLRCDGPTVAASLELRAGDEVWCAFGPREDEHPWSSGRAAAELAAVKAFWRSWLRGIDYHGPRAGAIKRSAMLVHLLTFAPTGAVAAAVSACLPERSGGRRNYDYRFSWVRDASLALALLSRLGSTEDAQRFLDWLAHLDSESDMPLQVLYRIDGGCDASPVERGDIDGYRSSRPVRFGNRAATMWELGSFGFLADCAFVYLQHGGCWKDEYWALVCRLADFTAAKFARPGASIWEITHEHHYVASKVMSWLTLDRAVKIARRTGRRGVFVHDWARVRDLIRDEVLDRGWSDELGSFRQCYDGDSVDAALLLIPLSGFLPVDDPRVIGTVGRIVDALEANGFLHRFVPRDVAGDEAPPLVEAEGAFLMCTFWLAQYFARRGECARAEAILRKAEAIAGEPGIFSEAVDPRFDCFLGNTPLLFSQVEYANAAIALTEAQGQPRDASRRERATT